MKQICASLAVLFKLAALCFAQADSFRISPIEAEVSPFPRELTTPPVTKMYLVTWLRPFR